MFFFDFSFCTAWTLRYACVRLPLFYCMPEIRKIPIEAIRESDRKSKEKTEIEKKAEIAQKLERKKDKEKLLERLEKDKKLAFLKSMVERDLIAPKTAEAIVLGGELDIAGVEEIFEKIDAIESTHDIDRILPSTLRLTKEEYVKALHDGTSRKDALGKIDLALAHIYQVANPNPLSVLHFFGGFMLALDRNLVLVQEHTIDIKRSLSKG
jgi:hypothetical protein